LPCKYQDSININKFFFELFLFFRSCGYYHTAVVTEDGQLLVCGNNDDRQFGRSVSDKFPGLVKVSLPNKVLAVACGHQHTIVLTENGQVYACGMRYLFTV
jgi:alpha-tubulin suppressor-like RCC1 family protein